MAILTATEAVEYLKKKGIEITRNGLDYIARKHGFQLKDENGYHNNYDTQDLDAYAKDQKVPKGWLSVEDFCDRFEVKTWRVYDAIKYGLIESKRCKGALHVHINKTKKFFKRT